MDPAAAGGADAEPHLAVQRAGAVAVAVDRHRHACRHRRPGMFAIQIQVTWRPIDLQRGAGFSGSRVDGGEVQRVSGAVPDQLVGRVGDHVDERVPDRLQAPPGEGRTVLLRRVVKRGENDVQLFEDVVGEIQSSISKDVDLDPVQDRDLRILRPQPKNLLPLTGERLETERSRGGGSWLTASR